jgi:Flp pilus assembly protein TadD
MADRYTYLPSIGLALMICWSVPKTKGTAVAAGIATLALAAATWRQAAYWKDSVTLFTRAIEVTRDNGIAHSNLGLALYQRGDLEGAIRHDREAIRILPHFQPPRSNLGVALADAGRIDEAIASTAGRSTSIHRIPTCTTTSAPPTTARTGSTRRSRRSARPRALEPDHANATYNLGTALAAKGDYAAAVPVLREAVRLDPGNPSPHANLASVLTATGDIDGAWREVNAMRALGKEPSASLLEKLKLAGGSR